MSYINYKQIDIEVIIHKNSVVLSRPRIVLTESPELFKTPCKDAKPQSCALYSSEMPSEVIFSLGSEGLLGYSRWWDVSDL